MTDNARATRYALKREQIVLIRRCFYSTWLRKWFSIVKNVEIRAFEKKIFYHLKTMIQCDIIFMIFDDVCFTLNFVLEKNVEIFNIIH
jgi:hypothetical protein